LEWLVSESLTTLVAALIAAAAAVTGTWSAIWREVSIAKKKAKSRRAAWIAYLSEIRGHMVIDRPWNKEKEDSVLSNMLKVDASLDLILPVAYDPNGIDSLMPQQIEAIVGALLETKLAAKHIRAVTESGGMNFGGPNEEAKINKRKRMAVLALSKGASEKISEAIQLLHD
jgi:hypothetical protein